MWWKRLLPYTVDMRFVASEQSKQNVNMNNASIFTISNHHQKQAHFLLKFPLKKLPHHATTTIKQLLCCHTYIQNIMSYSWVHLHWPATWFTKWIPSPSHVICHLGSHLEFLNGFKELYLLYNKYVIQTPWGDETTKKELLQLVQDSTQMAYFCRMWPKYWISLIRYIISQSHIQYITITIA